MAQGDARAVEGLFLDDAVRLATALSQHVARDAGIRTLVIKGPLAADQGLREPRVSSDVDLLVDPARFDDLLAAFGRYGWIARPSAAFPILLGLHSRTLVHPRWNCDIDVHHYWPGFLGEPGEVFEHLWGRRQALPIAKVPVDSTGTVDSALVLALHWLREAGHTEASSRKMHDYRYLIAQVQQDPALIDAVMASAVDADAVQTARPFLTELGFDVAEERNPSEALRRWNLNVHARHRMTGWMLQLREASVWQKPGVIMRAVFPSASDLRAIDPQIGDGRAAVVAGWWRRFARGVRSAPQVVHDLREHYRSD